MDDKEFSVRYLEDQVDEKNRIIDELHNALKNIYSMRGEDELIANLCSPLIDKYR
jgi:hypothetical protein